MASATMAPAGSCGHPARRHAGQPGPFGLRHRGQPFGQGRDVGVLQDPLDVGALAGRGRAGDPGQLAEGLRGPHHVIGRSLAAACRRPPWRSRARTCLRRRRTSCADGGSQLIQSLVRRPGAERQRGHRVRLLVDARGHLERPAADVDDQQPPGRPAEPAPGGQERQPGLLLAGHHVDLRTGLVPDPGQDLLAVLGLPDGRGRERDEVLDPLVLRDPQRLATTSRRLRSPGPDSELPSPGDRRA